MGATSELDVIGGATKASSQYSAGKTKDNLEMANASIADQQAKSEMTAAGYNTNLVRQKAAQIQGNQVASIGANGLQQRGTPALVVADTARTQEANALQVQNNALRRAWGFEVQGSSDTFQGQQALRGGMLSGVGDLISAGGSAYKDAENG